MKINKAIRLIMRQKGISLSAMGSSLRKIDRTTGEVKPLIGNDVSARLNNDNLSFDKALEMLNVLGYEIVVREKKQGGRRADQLVINQQDDKIDLDTLLSDDEPKVSSKKTEKIKLTKG